MKKVKDKKIAIQSTTDFSNYILKKLETNNKEQRNIKNTCIFDPDDKENYKALVEGLTLYDKYLQNYGNVRNIEWDYDILENVVKTILSYRNEIKRSYPLGTYSDFNLISSYIYNAMCYSIINQKPEQNYQSLLSTFKDWEDVPYKIKLKIAADLIYKLDLKEIVYPFVEKYKPKENSKIISFLDKKRGKSNEQNN